MLAGSPMTSPAAVAAATAPGDVGRFDFSVTAPVVTEPTTVHGAFTPSSAARQLDRDRGADRLHGAAEGEPEAHLLSSFEPRVRTGSSRR